MRFYLFGHALYEKALRPFTGITGRGIVLRTGPELLAAPLAEQLAAIDAGIARHISRTRAASRHARARGRAGAGRAGLVRGQRARSVLRRSGLFPARRTRAVKGQGSRARGEEQTSALQHLKLVKPSALGRTRVVRFFPAALLAYIAWSALSSMDSKSAP